MGLGFELSESMSGSYYLHEAPLVDRAIALSLRLDVDGMRRFLRERTIAATGTIDLEGICERAPLHGTVAMRLFDERRVPYDLAFEAGEGDARRALRLRGQRDFFVHDAAGSLTLLAASLFDDRDREIGRAMLRFDPRTELPVTLRSFRPRVRARLLSKG